MDQQGTAPALEVGKGVLWLYLPAALRAAQRVGI